MTYRPDIDGLRAISILLVVFYHANVTFLSGGYVGVDVFFVISGYLITNLLVRELEDGRFNLRAFAMRRARRLLPAAAVVMAGTAIFALLFYSPKDFRDFAGSLISFGLMLSNWYFMQDAGYFSAAAETKLLLHTWSLSIEEQFYLVFPVFLMVSWRFGAQRRLPVVLALMALLSLGYGCWLLSQGAGTQAFFHSGARAAGLFAGCALALTTRSTSRIKFRTGWVVDSVALLGGLLIVLPGILYTKATPFPGVASLPPLLGGLILLAVGGRGGRFDRLLAASPLNYVGRLSYAWYMWHWPLIVAFAAVWPDAVSWNGVLAAFVSFGLAAITYHKLEQPVRSARLLGRQQHLLAFVFFFVLSLLILGVIGFNEKVARKRWTLLHKDSGEVAWQLDAAADRYLRVMDKAYDGESGPFVIERDSGMPCSYDNGATSDRVRECLRANLGGGGVLVMGDSIGREAFFALRQAFPQYRWAMLHQSSCMGVDFTNAVGKSCFADWSSLLAPLLRDGQVRGVVLAARLFPEEYQRYASTINVLQGYKVPVAIVAGGPSYLSFVKEYLLRAYLSEGETPLSVDPDNPVMVRKGQRAMVADLANRAPINGYTFINTEGFYMDGERYSLFLDRDLKRPLIFDREHMSLDAFERFQSFLSGHPELLNFLDSLSHP